MQQDNYVNALVNTDILLHDKKLLLWFTVEICAEKYWSMRNYGWLVSEWHTVVLLTYDQVTLQTKLN